MKREDGLFLHTIAMIEMISKQEQSEGLQSLAGRISHVYKLYI